MGISALSRLKLWVIAAMLMLPATSVESDTRKIRVASLNLCTDTLLLQYADPQQIASITWLSTDPNLSPFAVYAEQFQVNRGRAEDILRLSIDLVLTGPSTSSTTRALLKRLEIKTLHLPDPTSITMLETNVRRLTQAIGQYSRGAESLQQMNRKLEHLSSKSANTPKHRWPHAAFLQPNGLTVGLNSLSDELLNYAGYQNSAALLGLKTYQRFPLESILRAQPELLIVPADQRSFPALAHELLRHPAMHNVSIRHEIAPFELICGTTRIGDVALALAARRETTGSL